MEYADIVVTAIGVFAVAWTADMLTGRRGLFAALLVAGVSAVCGWFLAVRVFGIATMDGLLWTVWAIGAAVLGLIAFHLFRNTR